MERDSINSRKYQRSLAETHYGNCKQRVILAHLSENVTSEESVVEILRECESASDDR